MNRKQRAPQHPSAGSTPAVKSSTQNITKSSGTKPFTSQPTISELFSTTTKPIDPSSTTSKLALDTTPKNKRQKLSHPSSPSSPTTPTSLAPNRRPSHIPEKSMYTFLSTRPRPPPNASNTVDLTGSPSNGASQSSPRKQIPARPRPNLHPELGAKKIVVKNLRVTGTRTNPRQYLQMTWEKLEKSLDAVFAGEEVPYSMEELYKGVENVCRQKLASELHGKLEDRAKRHIAENVRASLLGGIGETNISVLREVVKSWQTWTKQMEIVRDIFFYMDRAYLLPSKKPLIQDMAVSLFRDIIFNNKQLQPKIVRGICDFIAADRNGNATDEELARQAVSMSHSLGVYTTVVDPKLLHEAQKFVNEWMQLAVVEKALPDYLRSADQLMKTEIERCDVLGLDLKSTKRDLLALLEDHLIQRPQDYLLNNDAIADLLDDNAVEDLERLYDLLARKQLAEKITKPFSDWIDLTGTDIVYDEKESENMVVRLLTMKGQLDNLWRKAFRRNMEIGHGLRKAFEVFINKTKKTEGAHGTDNSRTGEMIAKYVDMLLRGGSKVIPAALTKKGTKSASAEEVEDNEDPDEEQQVDDQLDQVLDLFRFVQGKAVFEAFYKKDLARRLLMGRSASSDAERSMLTRLRTECGSGFTQNLEQMFRDVELGRDEMASYKQFLTGLGADPKVDLNVNILSAAAWPSYPEVKVNIPREVAREIERFQQHYHSKHNGRKLEWKHALAHCQLRANFPKGRKEIIVSSFQAIVLLLFNGVAEDEHISYERLLAETGLPEIELQRTLQSLACAKLRPLRKHPLGREINTTDTFTLDSSFSHDRYRIKINQVQLKETKEENKETHERIFEDRNFETQAAIVRIMKSKKALAHAVLVAEVIEMTRKRGVLDVQGIKRNIEKLIEKEYMERLEDGRYGYVA